MRSRRVGQAIQKFMISGFQSPEETPEQSRTPQSPKSNKGQGDQAYNKHVCTRQSNIKDQLLLNRQVKNYEKEKLINECQYRNGISRQSPNSLDQFVLTRILNRPELIFN